MPHCAICKAGNDDVCSWCASGFKVKEGSCVCRRADEKVNLEGVCEPCLVSGCLLCASGEPNTCLQCSNEIILLNKQCFCQKGSERLSAEGECERCLVEGCTSCTGEHECLECENGLTLAMGRC